MAEQKKATKEPQKGSGKRIAVIRIRGLVEVRHDFKKTMELLRLHTKNICIVLQDTTQNRGMVEKVKDYVTYGEIDDATFDMLVQKRGEEYVGRVKDNHDKIDYDGRYFEVNKKKYKKFFRLNSPKKGFGRKGIKKAFSQGGALGNRGEKIKDLIDRMI